MLRRLWSRMFGPRGSLVDSGQIRRGDGVWESLVGGASDGAPSEREALAVSAVYACVNLRAGSVSSLPMHIYRQDEHGDRDRDMTAALWWVLNEEFAPRWTAAAGWSFLVASRLLHGDAFAEIVRTRSGAIRYLVPLHPDRVRVIASPDGMRLVYEIAPDRTIATPDPDATQYRVLDQDDVLHVPGFGYNGLNGLSPLRYALRTAGRVAINAQDFSNSVLRNHGRPDYVLQTDKALTDEQFERLRGMIDTHTGPANAGKPIILEGGLKVNPLTMPMEDMQLLESRRFQVEEIARIYGVPPFMIGHAEKTSSWGSGVEAMGTGFVRYTLRDDLNAFQNEINRKFFRTPRVVAEFDTTELERADTQSLFTALRVALGRAGEPAFMTIEEVRRRLNLPQRMTGTVPATSSPPPADQTEEKPE